MSPSFYWWLFMKPLRKTWVFCPLFTLALVIFFLVCPALPLNFCCSHPGSGCLHYGNYLLGLPPFLSLCLSPFQFIGFGVTKLILLKPCFGLQRFLSLLSFTTIIDLYCLPSRYVGSCFSFNLSSEIIKVISLMLINKDILSSDWRGWDMGREG